LHLHPGAPFAFSGPLCSHSQTVYNTKGTRAHTHNAQGESVTLPSTLPSRFVRPPAVFSSSFSRTCTLARHSHSQSRCVHTHGESFALPSTLPSRFVRPPAVFSSSSSRTCTLARHSQSTHRPSSRSRSACTSARPPKWPCASSCWSRSREPTR